MRSLIFLIFFLPSVCLGANIYVDPGTTESDATWTDRTEGGEYISTDPDFPGTGVGYSTINAALSAMSSGDDIYLRGGEYDNAQLGTGTYNTLYLSTGVAGTSENYSSIQSFPGEWAILDGENNAAGAGSGRSLGVIAPSSDGYDTASRYWKFERLEIKNGITSDGANGGAISASYGPIIVRYCYLHDNKASSGANNPAAILGYRLGDSVIEYNYFDSNGCSITSSHNCCQVQFFSDYATVRDSIATDGFASYDSSYHVQNNIVRYNYFNDAAVGITTKGNQLFTGRSQDSGDEGWSDAYSDRGNEYHHNIFQNFDIAAILSKDDFIQIHNNIVDSSTSGIRLGSEGRMYKPVVYNNTVIGNANDAADGFHAAIGSMSAEENNDYSITSPENTLYAYFYNNIIDDADDYNNLCEFSIGREGTSQHISSMDYSNVDIEALYSYRPDDTNIISIYESGGYRDDDYTATTWVSNFGGSVYTNAYNSEDLLWQDTTGADQYKIESAHVVDAGVTAGAGGRGGNHPYLSGVTIPEYFGAANPDDDSWVDGVLGLNSTVMTSAEAGSDPNWIEGSGAVSQITYIINASGNRIKNAAGAFLVAE